MKGRVFVPFYFKADFTSSISPAFSRARRRSFSRRVSSLWSKKRQTADIFLLPEMYFTAPKCNSIKRNDSEKALSADQSVKTLNRGGKNCDNTHKSSACSCGCCWMLLCFPTSVMSFAFLLFLFACSVIKFLITQWIMSIHSKMAATPQQSSTKMTTHP